ncbi:MAG TPA: VTT domain-containing protein [Bacteroidales bacterium]|nr:VTT domain-containing protein [Bacteroidales bacterium]
MDSILQIYKDPSLLIEFGGVVLILIVIYLETGFFLGLVLPGGDYLVFTAGLLCGTHYIDISFVPMLLLMMGAAILGDFTGYLKGRWLGPKLFSKPDSRFFKREYLDKTRKYYEHYGVWSFILGRFLPVIRTLVPILAGASGIRVIKFSYFNISGAVCWIGLLTSLGYFLGERFPNLLNYSFLFLIGFIILVSLPVIKMMNPFKKNKTLN